MWEEKIPAVSPTATDTSFPKNYTLQMEILRGVAPGTAVDTVTTK